MTTPGYKKIQAAIKNRILIIKRITKGCGAVFIRYNF
jgi:hypothetical protein